MLLLSCKKHHVSKNIHGGNMSKLKNRIKDTTWQIWQDAWIFINQVFQYI